MERPLSLSMAEAWLKNRDPAHTLRGKREGHVSERGRKHALACGGQRPTIPQYIKVIDDVGVLG